MKKLGTTQPLGWLIGLFLLFSWNLQAEVNPDRIASPHPVRPIEFLKLLTPAEDFPPLNLTATVGVPFQQVLPYLIPMENSFTMSVTGLPDNGLRVGVSSGFPALPIIEGIPLTSGVMNLTLVNTSSTSGTVWRAIIIAVSPPLPPPPPLNLTATVGVPFQQVLPYLIPMENSFTMSVTGLPDNGLRVGVSSGFPALPIIEGIPLTSGVMNLTLVNTSSTSGTVWRAIIIAVSPPLPPPPPLNLTATVGTPFIYSLPTALIPSANVIYTATGLPAYGLSFNGSTIPATISGTPTTAGVLSVTITATPDNDPTLGPPVSAFYIITINPAPGQPPVVPVITSLTATVGTPFLYSLLTALIPSFDVTYTAIGLPANGLSFIGSPIPPTISGTPTTAGVLSVTVTATPNTNNPLLGPPVSAIYLITINPAPDNPSPNNPPVAPSIPDQTATVGVAYFQNTPSFTDPDGQAIAVQAFGLPPGLSYTGTASGIVAGTPTLAGVYSVSLVGTDLGNSTSTGGLSATAVYTITVAPASPGGGSLMLLAPTYNCTTGGFTFNTSGGDGSPITYAAIGITGPTTNPNQFVDTELRTAADAPLITLTATQNGTFVTYVWNIRAVCPVGPGTPPVNPPDNALTLLTPTYNCDTGAFRFNTSGGDGSPITYAAIGITGPTTKPDQFVDTDLRTAADAPLIVLSATQNGTTVTYLWNIRAQCPVGPGTPPVDPPVGSALVLLTPGYNCETGAFTFNTSGGNGTAIEYRAVPGITDWTTNPNQFVDEGSRTANDVQPFLLQARQNGVLVSYEWNLKAACGRARQGAGELERRLRVVVLGNPVMGETVQLEVSGAEGQPLRVALTNLQGKPVSEMRIGQAAATERIRVPVGHTEGVYLLQVSSPAQTNVTRVIKTE